MTLCDTFKRLALHTWHFVHDSRLSKFQLKEETVTDLNMLAIKQLHSREVHMQAFTKREEGKNGADWEWWFTNASNQWIGFRVQAKIINIASNEFEHLHYKSPTTGTIQCDNLIKEALANPYPKIPLYCLYLQTDDTGELPQWNCPTVVPINYLWGCSLASAFSVKRLRAASEKHLTHLEPYLRMWHCLVCCTGHGGRNSIERINNYSSINFGIDSEAATELGLEVPDSFIIDTPPPYVLNILTNDNIGDILPPDNLGGVLIYTFDDAK